MKKFKTLLISMVLLCLGCTQETLQDQTLIYSNLPPIRINGNNELYKKDVDKLIDECIKSQPKFILNDVKEIVICSQDNYEDYQISDTSVAFSNPNDMKVYCRISVNKEAITHELVHIYDYAKGYHYYSESKEFILLYEKYKGTFHFENNEDNQYEEEELNKYDHYFNASVEEYFAESSQLYINDKEYLKQQCIEIYNYLNKIYKQYNE